MKRLRRSDKLAQVSMCALATGIFLAFWLPVASAHEVYVLSADAVARGTAALSPNPFSIISTHQYEFALWALIGIVLVSTVFAISITKRIEEFFYPFLLRLKSWAPLMGRLTLGVALLSSVQFGALFGPELGFSAFAGGYEGLAESALYLSGALVLFGFWTRVGALLALAVFLAALMQHGLYLLTYANYLGLILFVGILGGGSLSVDGALSRAASGRTLRIKRRLRSLEPYAYPILRVLFGVAVFSAAFYAKFLYSELALETIAQYHLTDYFRFDPLFIVLGALIVETLMALFFIAGFELRHTSLFFLFWLLLSLLYFGETVWPHLILFGINFLIIMHGYDRYSVGGLFMRGRREPVL